MSEHDLVVRFTGKTSGRGPFMWGQIAIWDVLQWKPPGDTSLNRLGQWEVPAGVTMDRLADALRALIERHDSLRSVYYETSEGLVQEVRGDGELTVEVHEIGAADAGDVARTVGEDLRGIYFDRAADLPVRLAVAVRDGEPEVLLGSFSHMAVDASSFGIVSADLVALMRGETLAPPGQQPLERAEYEGSGIGRSREERALAFWSAHVAKIPRSMLARVRGGNPPDFVWALLDSPAMALAARSLAWRFALEPGVVLLGGASLLLAAYTGEEEAALRMIVATRFQPAARELVGAFNQNALFHVDIVDEPLEAYLRRAANAQLLSFRNSEYHPRKLEALVSEVSASRGFDADGYCFLNDVRTAFERIAEPDLIAAESLVGRVEEALPGSRLEQLPDGSPTKGANLFLYLHDTAEQAYLRLGTERAFLTPRGPIDYLRDLERLIVRAAREPGITVTRLASEFTG